MKVQIAKRFSFDAAHFVPCFPEGHKCRGMHGHTYEVELILYGDTKGGLLVDYADIAEVWRPVGLLVDHKVLNEIAGLEIPTTEVLVGWIFDRLTSDRRAESQPVLTALAAVRVYESSSTWCEVSARDWTIGHGR